MRYLASVVALASVTGALALEDARSVLVTGEDGLSSAVLLDRDKTLVGEIEEAVELSAAVRRTLLREATGGRVEAVEVDERRGHFEFEVVVEGREYEITIDREGTLLDGAGVARGLGRPLGILAERLVEVVGQGRVQCVFESPLSLGRTVSPIVDGRKVL